MVMDSIEPSWTTDAGSTAQGPDVWMLMPVMGETNDDWAAARVLTSPENAPVTSSSTSSVSLVMRWIGFTGILPVYFLVGAPLLGPARLE